MMSSGLALANFEARETSDTSDGTAEGTAEKKVGCPGADGETKQHESPIETVTDRYERVLRRENLAMKKQCTQSSTYKAKTSQIRTNGVEGLRTLLFLHCSWLLEAVAWNADIRGGGAYASFGILYRPCSFL